MARLRNFVTLSAILIAPLGALLAARAFVTPPADPAAPTSAEVEHAAPAPAAVETPATPAAEAVAPPPAAPPPAEPAASPEPAAPSPPAATPPEPAATPPVAPPPEPPAAPTRAGSRDPGQAMLLLGDALVLRVPAEHAWGRGRAAIKAEAGHMLAEKSVRWASVPEPARGLERAPVVIYRSDGSVCVTEAREPRLRLERIGDALYPEPGSDSDYGAEEPPASRAALVAVIEAQFKRSTNLFLLAQQNSSEPCEGEWARRADLPPPVVFGRGEASDAEAAEALAVLRAQPEFAALAAGYAEWHKEAFPGGSDDDTWEKFVAENFRAARWAEINGSRRLVSVELKDHDDSCGFLFRDGVALLLERRGDGLARLDQPGWFRLTALMDIDGDGLLEGVSREHPYSARLHAVGPDAAVFADEYAIPDEGDPC